tara:strand:- start:2852 stop:3571 length:720 start_codon:yes stop_codon:yes gene_type:complete
MSFGTADAAVCVTGQLRTLVVGGLHERIRKFALDALPADVFLHVDASDTREWGRHRNNSAREYEAALQVLRPVAARMEHFAPSAGSRCAGRLARSGGNSDGTATTHVCHAHDCGSFNCGCYLPECTHCEVSRYIPMHEHNRRCLALIAGHEARRGRRYEFVIKLRPDLELRHPIPHLSRLAAGKSRTLSPHMSHPIDRIHPPQCVLFQFLSSSASRSAATHALRTVEERGGATAARHDA